MVRERKAEVQVWETREGRRREKEEASVGDERGKESREGGREREEASVEDERGKETREGGDGEKG